MKPYDVIVIGGGPGGYTAALYAARAGLKALVLEKLSAGGQMALTDQIDNYPGFPQGIPGIELGQRMMECAIRFGVETIFGQVIKLRLLESPKKVMTSGQTYCAKTVILATGADHRSLGLANEQQFVGKGVSYCAACDGMFFRNKTVAVVGGGNSAAHEAIHLSHLAKEVILIHRRNTLRCELALQRALQHQDNIKILYESSVTALHGQELLSEITVRNSQTGQNQIQVDGIFISIGRSPNSQLVEGLLALDDAGYIQADETTCTSIPGVYAVGDVRTKPVRQIVTAVSDGASASFYVQKYITQMDSAKCRLP